MLIEQRIAKAKNTLFASVGGALLLFLLVVYVSVSIYYAIMGSIRTLVRSAHTLAAGDLNVRVWLDTHDEISHIGESFNRMAESFSALLDERKQAEQEIKDLSAQLQHILASTPALHYACRIDGGRFVPSYASPNIQDLWGYAPEEYLGNTGWWWSGLHPDGRDGVAAALRAVVMGSDAVRHAHEYRFRHNDGTYRWVLDEMQIIRDPQGRPLEIVGSWLDITERKQVEQNLAESRERLHAIIETALDAVVQMDTEGRITGWNAQAEKTFGWAREEALGRAMDETIIPHQYREAHRKGLQRFLASGEGAILNSQVELSALHRDGHEFPIELSIVPIRMGDRYEFSAFIDDITDRKKSEEVIWRQANFDDLTGLPNRHMFYDRLVQDIRKADRSGLPLALLYIDLDHFKEVNDTLGHSMGDILLVEAARRIGASVRESDTVARLGGDEFIIVLTELHEAARIDALTQDVLRELAEPFRLGRETAYVSASIGITLYPHDAADMEELVKNADQAMYAAKNAGRNRFSYFTPGMQQAAQVRLKLSNDLRGALAGGQFEVYYQPIVELDTGRVRKAEALLRWRHPERGFVSPAEFIPLAEESGLINEIGDWVFREAAARARLWRAGYDPEFQVSVNMSPIQFRAAAACQSCLAHLRELGLPGQSMVIEIDRGVAARNGAGRGGRTAALPRGGHAAIARRFRHGVFRAVLSPEVRHRLPEDRPVLYPRTGAQVGQHGAFRGHHRDGAPARHEGDRRGRGNRGAARAAGRRGLRLRPGLFVLPARCGRGVRGAAQELAAAVAAGDGHELIENFLSAQLWRPARAPVIQPGFPSVRGRQSMGAYTAAKTANASIHRPPPIWCSMGACAGSSRGPNTRTPADRLMAA